MMAEIQQGDPIQRRVAKIIEIQKGIKILRERLTTSKRDLLEYFTHNPQYKNKKYSVDDYTLHYVDKRQTDGISQKLITSALSQYFRSKGVQNVTAEVNTVLSMIRNQRQTKVVPTLDIRSKSGDDAEGEP